MKRLIVFGVLIALFSSCGEYYSGELTEYQEGRSILNQSLLEWFLFPREATMWVPATRM